MDLIQTIAFTQCHLRDSQPSYLGDRLPSQPVHSLSGKAQNCDERIVDLIQTIAFTQCHLRDSQPSYLGDRLPSQPVHSFSGTMTNSEKRYSQTEKDALAVHWAKRKFSIYFLGAPKLKIITAHKPFLPMFNKATTRLPPKIEKWVMGMQDGCLS